MKKVTFVVHQKYIENVIKNLHEKGIIEIINIENFKSDTIEEVETATMHPECGLCANYELRLTRLIDILKSLKKKPSGIKAMFNPITPDIRIIEESSPEDIYSHIEGTLADIEKKILDDEEKINKINEKIEHITENIKSVSYLKNFELDLSYLGKSEFIIMKAGKTSDLLTLKNELDKIENTFLQSKQIGKGKHIEWSVIIVSYISEERKIEKICREKIIEFTFTDISGTPDNAFKSLQKNKKELIEEKKQIISKMDEYSNKKLQDLLILKEQIKIEKRRKEISINFGKTDSSYLVKGWILEKDEGEFKKLISESSEEHVDFYFETPSNNPDNPPTYLEIPKWARSFKTLLELFATPRYNEINPTIIMGIFFILFFGLMLGDAGYGLIIIFLSLFGYIKFSKYKTMIKDWAFMGIWIGIITTIVGILTYSFFGDLVPRFFFNDPNKILYSFTLAGINFPIEPIRNPLTILIVALLLGLIHLNLGIFLAIYQCYKNKDMKSLLTKHFSWILLQIGGGLLIGDMLLHIWSIGTIQLYVSIIFVILGLILRLINAGPLGLFDITGFIGDWLSYARLLALGLGTTGMALAFNVVGQIIPDMVPVIGIILGPIILIITHIANLGIQALGAAVHSLRLQYVEFFNRFYEGGGKEFKPFSVKRKFTVIKETELD